MVDDGKKEEKKKRRDDDELQLLGIERCFRASAIFFLEITALARLLRELTVRQKMQINHRCYRLRESNIYGVESRKKT